MTMRTIYQNTEATRQPFYFLSSIQSEGNRTVVQSLHTPFRPQDPSFAEQQGG